MSVSLWLDEKKKVGLIIMNDEIRKLDEYMNGMAKWDFATFSGLPMNRDLSPFTWDDLAFNLNNKPFETDTAIIVTSYFGQLGWLKATLTNYRKSGAYVILAYDNSVYVWHNIEDKEYSLRMFPRAIHYLLAHSVVVKHRTYDSDKRIGWYWDVWYAQGIIKNLPNIKYVYCTNGDCVTDRPEGFKELPLILGDGDLMSGQSQPQKTIHTADLFMKVDAFHNIMDYMTSRMKNYVMASVSPECLLRDAVDTLGLKETFVEQPIDPRDGSVDYYCTQNADSTWKKVLGFRNLYHESEFTENHGLEPIDKKYFDPYMNWIYFRDEWKNTVFRYFETGDRRYLMQFWDRGKDTDTERKFLPLEAYGPEPIYGEVK